MRRKATAEEFCQCLRMADGWIIRNLKKYNNSAYPDKLISDERDIVLGEKLLSAIIGHPVEIRKTDCGYICERM